MKLQTDDLGIIGVVVEDWDITKPYRPKTITTDYSSWIAYISRKAVPANTPITDTEYWKPLTRLQTELTIDYNNFKNDIINQFNVLKSLVNTFLLSSKMGIPTVDNFGDSEIVSVNQKTLTEAISRIWQKFEELTGETLQGITMNVTPTFFVSENGCELHLTANTVDANGIFEWIEFWIDKECVYRAENVPSVEETVQIYKKDTYDYVVKCKAKIMGIEYDKTMCPSCEQIVTRYDEFFIGAGAEFTDIMNGEHAKQLRGRMRHNYDIDFEDNQKLIIVIGATLRDAFIRADLNGAEIDMEEKKLDVNGNVIADSDETTEVKYIGFMSEPWNEGRYNIDING